MSEAAFTKALAGLPGLDSSRLAGATVLIAGAGNIGSHLAPQLARVGVGTLRILDRDTVEAKNLATQDYRPEDLGRHKAEVLAERLRAQFPDRPVEAWVCDLEDAPLSVAAVDAVLGALDSRRARQVLATELAWPQGVPAIDGGVGEGLLGRVQVFVPGADSACLECTWGPADYRLLAAEYPCVPGAAAEAPPTISLAFLGTFVASVMTAECVRLIAGVQPAESYEVPFDLFHHVLRRFTLRRSPRCRHDHEVVRTVIDLGGVAPTVGSLVDAVDQQFGTGPAHLECRRPLRLPGLGANRFVPLDALRDHWAVSLESAGFRAGDRVRVRGADGSVFLDLPL
jgi:molybdopterin/thiamine biosynthesis adenylyltransferase